MGFNSSSGVIIVADISKFKGVKDRKRASIISVLLNIVFNVADLQKK